MFYSCFSYGSQLDDIEPVPFSNPRKNPRKGRFMENVANKKGVDLSMEVPRVKSD